MYTDELNVHVLIDLLKAYNIKHIIASPGTTNSALIGSVQDDAFFTVYSCVDERSAAYMACGLTSELNEPVVISCTGATASRNYAPGLTEAYYRKLPVLAVTSTQPTRRVGHLVPQVIDRSQIALDVAKLSLSLPVVRDQNDIWECEISVNKALQALTCEDRGPVHINLPTVYKHPFTKRVIGKYRKITLVEDTSAMPPLNGTVAIFIGAISNMTISLKQRIEDFSNTYHVPVFCDHTSGYNMANRIQGSLMGTQATLDMTEYLPYIMIHIGEVSGDYPTNKLSGKEIWRVSPDGEIRDTFQRLRKVFKMSPERFFAAYNDVHKPESTKLNTQYLRKVKQGLSELRENMPELPFSNIWIGKAFSQKIPPNSHVHFAILNSLRSWNLFDLPEGVESSSNVGGFGIDGCLSTAIGIALASPDKTVFCVTGDLAFFYDMNAIGNRHCPKNLRILLINNGTGTEFKQYNHHVSNLEKDLDRFIAASGHYGNKSKKLVKNYVQNLGFSYSCASTPSEFNIAATEFFQSSPTTSPSLLEVFTNSNEESKALEMINNIATTNADIRRKRIKSLLGVKNVKKLRKLLGRKY